MNTFQLTSSYTGASYNIDMYIPNGEVPKEGFHIIYVLDGQSYFFFIRDIIRIQQKNTAKTRIPPAIVVGVGHGQENSREQRFLDFTAPAETLKIPDHAKGKLPEGNGGASLFYEFLENELKPLIEKRNPINRNKQFLFGHSLGGYFALWCLFTNPAAYKAYLAISPSVWWNGEELFSMAQQFIEKGANGRNNSVFLAVGEREGHMVDGAVRMGRLMRDYGLPLECYIGPDENHASIVPTAASRGLRYCFERNNF